VALGARWVALGARWATLRARWVTDAKSFKEAGRLPAGRCFSSRSRRRLHALCKSIENSCTNSIGERTSRSHVPISKPCLKPIRGVRL
jgi:hypothetical protein